jgi:pimeloyl-ACP methyl ester carboxylesterase
VLTKKIIIKGLGFWLNFLARVNSRKCAETALKIFCMPMRVPVNKKHILFLDTATRSSFLFNDVRVESYKWGNGARKILFLHGWQSHTYRWRKYIEAFDPNLYTLFSIDAPGHGLSAGKFLSVPTYGDAIDAFIGKEGPMDALIGHSMGCFAGLYAMNSHPHITPGAFVGLASPGEATEFVEHFKKTLSLSDRTIALLLDKFQEVFKKSPADFSARRFASTLEIPALLIHDEEDQDTNVNHSRDIHQVWKNSSIVVTRGLGHNLRSDEIVKTVSRFIDDSIGRVPK